jgi:hypothetical protein
MSIILLLVGGLLSFEAADSPSFETGASCIEALHLLRTEERLDIVSTEVLEDNVLAFTLTDGPRRAEKTAILICQRDLDAAEDEGDPGIVDDGDFVDEGTDDLAPIEETDDTIGDETEETDETGEPVVE